MQTRHPTQEKAHTPAPGYLMVVAELALFGLALTSVILGAVREIPLVVVLGVLGLIAWATLLAGFFIVEPNVARVLVLFGRYRGTVRENGFWYTNPFTVKKKVSVRVHNLNGKTLKVNDLMGNPIEIAAIVVWQVRDTAQATFDVESFEGFVDTQSEAAVRYVASRHPYDDALTEDVATTLRGSADEIAQELQTEVSQRVSIAGVEVLEARLSHLAYAPEIAAAMLQRQQASAIIAARTKIVDGAVGMVGMALEKLAEQNTISLDDERKATLVGNLLVVLCGQEHPVPVLNTGTLYN